MLRLRDMPFQRKLAVASFATSAVILLLVGAVFTISTIRTYHSTLQRQLSAEADIIGFAAAPALVFDDQGAASAVLAALRAEPQVVAAAIYAVSGEPFATYMRADAAAVAPPDPGVGGQGMEYREGYFELRRAIEEGGRSLGTVFLRVDPAELESRILRDGATVAAVLAVSLLATLGLARLLHREIARPVLDLAGVARQVAVDRDYSVRVEPRGNDELGSLVQSFNHMLGEVQTRDVQLRRINRELRQRTDEVVRKNEEVESFVYVVSHDLRAPLVNLQGYSRELQLSCADLARCLRGVDLPPAPAAEMETILNQDIPGSLRFITASTTKFERLINALLQLSRTGRRELRSERLDMDALAQATLDSLRRSIEDSGATVTLGPLPPALGDLTAIEQVLSNLLTNALRYRQPGRPARIEIGARAGDGQGLYFVRDNGVGIPEAAQLKLFQVFQRFRPDLADGEGVGLVTVKRLIERSGGRIWAESIEGEGTTFFFTLPLPTASEEVRQ